MVKLSQALRAFCVVRLDGFRQRFQRTGTGDLENIFLYFLTFFLRMHLGPTLPRVKPKIKHFIVILVISLHTTYSARSVGIYVDQASFAN